MYGMRVVDARFAAMETRLPTTVEETLDAEVWTHSPMFLRHGRTAVEGVFSTWQATRRLVLDLAARDGELARAVFPNVTIENDPHTGVQFQVLTGYADRDNITGHPSFICPVCIARSVHPRDVASGYCGRCHAFTGPGRG